MIRAPRAEELEAVAAFVAAQQATPHSRDAMFDERPEAIAVQLASWDATWTETSRLAERDAALIGFVGAEVDDSLNRVWVHGPLVDAPDWDDVADALLAALESELPRTAGMEAEIAADVENERVAMLATRRGYVPGKVHHLLVIHSSGIEQLSRGSGVPLAAERESAFITLHEELFPDTYYSGRQLLDQVARDEAVVLEMVEGGDLVGYAAGRIDEAGDGYLDFVGVAPERRRRGHGAALVTAIAHALRDLRPIAAMRLTVSSENADALALYRALGFEHQSSAVGYRRSPEPSA